jgi:hypothetical protein
MVRGIYIQRSTSEGMTFEAALKRYLADRRYPHQKPSTQKSEQHKACTLIEHLGKYSLAALTPELIANYRDTRLNSLGLRGKPISPNTVRLELALLRHLYIVAIQEWGLG